MGVVTDQQFEHLADGPLPDECLGHGQMVLDLIAVTTTDTFLHQVPGLREVVDDAEGAALADGETGGDVAEPDVRVVGDQQQGLAVVGEEGPSLHRGKVPFIASNLVLVTHCTVLLISRPWTSFHSGYLFQGCSLEADMSTTVESPVAAARRRSAPCGRRASRRSVAGRLTTAGVVGAAVVLGLTVAAPSAWAAQPPVGLGTATPFAVLAGTTVTNTGPSVISGDVGVDPGSAIIGFPPGTITNGTTHAADAVALQAQSDTTTAYNDAAGRTPVVTESSDLGGQTLAPGVYKAASALSLTGNVTLDGGGDPSAVFIFQAGSTLITASSSTVSLIGGAQACNVFWQVGSSATLGSTTTFVGTILALTSATLDTGATLQGRVLARNGQVSLDDNVITEPTCTNTTSGTTPTTVPGGAAGSTGGTTGGSGASATGGSGAAVSAATGSTATGAAATGAGTPAGTTSSVIPLGAPATGLGGAARSSGSPVLILAGAALLASGATTAAVTRRRRSVSAAVSASDTSGA